MFDPEEDDKLVWDILWVFLEEVLQDIHWVLCFSAVIVLLDIENWYLEAIEDMKDFLHPYGVWPWGSLGVLPQIMLSRIGVLLYIEFSSIFFTFCMEFLFSKLCILLSLEIHSSFSYFFWPHNFVITINLFSPFLSWH